MALSSPPPARRAATAAVACAAVLLATTGTAAELGPEELSSEAAAAWRLVLGAAVLAVAAAVCGAPPWRYPPSGRWTATGAAAVAVNQLAFFAAVDRTGVAVGTVTTVAAVPAAAGLIDLASGRRPGRAWAAGAVTAVAGVGLIGGAGGTVRADGVALAVASGAAAAVVGLAAQRLMRDRPVLPAMASVFGGGALLVLPVAAAQAPAALGSPAAAAVVLHLGLVTLAAAYALYGWGLGRLRLGTVAAIGLVEPAAAALLAVAVLGEPVTGGLVGGVVLVVAGVAIASRDPAAHGRPDAAE